MSDANARMFAGAEAKVVIRRCWDRPIIARACERLQRPLAYFGLPGPRIEDLLEWRNLLGPITGVERYRPNTSNEEEDQARVSAMLRACDLREIEQFQALRGDIEDIILDSLDTDGVAPPMNNGRPLQRMRFRYDLVNLDFLGGVGYKDRHGESRRVKAIKKLFERQQTTAFLLLLTLNVRDGIDDELTDYLQQTRNEEEGELRMIADWYANCQRGEKEYKLKAVVPLFVKRTAETYMFRSFAYPPIAYDGTGGARMVHFVFELTATQGNLRAFSQQGDEGLLRLPLLHVTAGVIRVARKQHQGFDFATWPSGDYAFSPDTCRDRLLNAPFWQGGDE